MNDCSIVKTYPTGKISPFLASLQGQPRPSPLFRLRTSELDLSPRSKAHLTLSLLSLSRCRIVSRWFSSVGEKAAFKGPFAKFPYKASELDQGIAVSPLSFALSSQPSTEHSPLFLVLPCRLQIAGGSGITPMYQLIAHALSVGPFFSSSPSSRLDPFAARRVLTLALPP